MHQGNSQHNRFRHIRAAALMSAVLLLAFTMLSPAAPALADCGSPTLVSNTSELNDAIEEFNDLDEDCDFQIEFSNEIILSSEMVTISNSSSADISLLVDGAGYILDASSHRPFRIEGTDNVVIQDLTISGSTDHGIDAYDSELTVLRSTIYDPFEFGIRVVLSNLNVIESLVVDSSVGILANSSTINVVRSTLVENQENGLSAEFSDVLIRDSSVYGNESNGVEVNFSSELTIINSTIFSNYRGVAVINESSALLVHVTNATNATGVLAEDDSSVEFRNSILTDNLDQCEVTEQSNVQFNYTLVYEDDPDCGVSDGLDGNIVGEDPMLAVPMYNGGPTLTMAIYELTGSPTHGSPAIDAGNNDLSLDESDVTLEFDQRGTGYPRQIGDNVDMGAYEGDTYACPTFPATVSDETEWRVAIFCYNLLSTPGERVIELLDDIPLTAMSPVIDNPTAGISLLVDGNSRSIDGQGILNNWPFGVVSGSVVTLQNLTITGGNVNGDGGGIHNEGDLTLKNVIVENNIAIGDGGGIYNAVDAVLRINGGEIVENTADYPSGDGGGIANDGEAYITDVLVAGNLARDAENVSGGGVLNEGIMTIDRSIITGNRAEAVVEEVFGGGIVNQANLIIRDSEISENAIIAPAGDAFGGGIFYDPDSEEVIGAGYGTQLTIINSTISGNRIEAEYAVLGGGLYAVNESVEFQVPVTLINVTLADNRLEADDDFAAPGASFATYSSNFPMAVTIHNSILADNLSNGAPSNDCLLWSSEGITFESRHSLYEATEYSACGLAQALTPDADGNLVGVDPQLEPLDDNGGPTQTHAIDDDSPAVDKGDNDLAVDDEGDPLTADQRGFAPRDFNGTVDMGAYEYGAGIDEIELAVFMSATKSGNADGPDYDNSDILRWDGEFWEIWFDGSAALLAPNNKPKHNTNAFWIPDPNSEDVVLSFGQNGRKVPGITPKVDGTDLVWWDGEAFTLWFDGSDVGLTKKTQEKIDGLHVLPGESAPLEYGGACEYFLLISTQGPGNVPAFEGGVLKFGGEDVLTFCATNLGQDTAGFWGLAFDGSAEGLPKNSTDSISMSEDLILYLTTKKPIKVGPIVGGHSSVFAYSYPSSELSGPHFYAVERGLTKKVDGLQVVGSLISE